MQLKESDFFKITTLLPDTLLRTQALPTPITAKFLSRHLSKSSSDALAAKLKVEYLTGTNAGRITAAWDLLHIVSATAASSVDADGWTVSHFDRFEGQTPVLQLDTPRQEFEFRFVVDVWGMKERVGEDAEGGVREKGRAEFLVRGLSETILVFSLEEEMMDDTDLDIVQFPSDG